MSDTTSTTRPFDTIELITDVFMLLLVLVRPKINLHWRQVDSSDAIGLYLIRIVVLFVYCFSIAYYLSKPYYYLSIKKNTLNIIKLITNDVYYASKISVFGLIVVSLIYSVLSGITAITIGTIAVAVQSFLFGFALGIEYQFERNPISKKRIEEKFRNLFDHSISDYLPYLITTIFLVLPVEYIIYQKMNYIYPIIKVIFILISMYLSYLVGKKLQTTVFTRIEITRNLNTSTAILLSILPIVAILGYGMWELNILDGIKNADLHLILKIIIIFFIGIIPLRLLHVIYSHSSPVNKVIGIIMITVFFITKLNISSFF